MIKRYKKITVAILIFLVIFSGTFLMGARKASAVDPASAALSVPTGVTYDVPGEGKEGLWGSGFGLDTVGYMAAKVALAQMTQSIVNWINTGFEGNPTFVQDPNGFLEDVANQASGALIEKLDIGDYLCSQFKPELIFSLKYDVPEMERFRCTLEDAVSNWEGFMDDFNQGGWKGWLKVTTEPQNNPWGAYLMAQDEIAKKKAEAQERQKMELSWGDGFLSLKECEGGTSQDDFCSESCAYLEGDDEAYDDCVNGCNDVDMGTSDLCDVSGGKMMNTTPGNIIADQLKLNLGSSVRQMELADEIGESLAAIFNALISQMITQGLYSITDEEGSVDNPPSDQELADAAKTVDNALISENDYEDVKKSTSDAYAGTIEKLSDLMECYQEQLVVLKLQNPKDDAKIAEVEAKIADTQARIDNYNAAKSSLDKIVSDSSLLISEAENLKLKILTAGSYAELESLLNEFTSEILPLVHNGADVQIATAEYESIKDTLDAENIQLDADYNQCVADLSSF